VSKYKFSLVERHAVYTVHGEKCYMCGLPLTVKTAEIDHVIPESLAEKPAELAKVLAELGRSPDFNVNSFENWMPACRACNGDKLAMVWEPSLAVQRVLQKAKAKAPEAAALAAKTTRVHEVHDALGVLERASETGELSEEIKTALWPLVTYQRQVREPEVAKEPVRLTPRYEVPLYTVLSDNGLIKTVRGPYGVGGGPSADAGPGMCCGTCGYPFFNGARCVICGSMED
jgi:5-methylcytosine-specific restriction endonuclease McrA